MTANDLLPKPVGIDMPDGFRIVICTHEYNKTVLIFKCVAHGKSMICLHYHLSNNMICYECADMSMLHSKHCREMGKIMLDNLLRISAHYFLRFGIHPGSVAICESYDYDSNEFIDYNSPGMMRYMRGRTGDIVKLKRQRS